MDTITIPEPEPTAEPTSVPHEDAPKKAVLFEPAIVKRAIGDAFVKLDPRKMAKNPVMFIVEIGSIYTTLLFFQGLPKEGEPHLFTGLVAAWLWFTVLFANFAEAVAEGRGKAQADTLRKTRSETSARVRLPDGSVEERPSPQLRPGDLVFYGTGPTTTKTSTHVDVVAAACPDNLHVIGGNVDDRVTERDVPLSGIYGWLSVK